MTNIPFHPRTLRQMKKSSALRNQYQAFRCNSTAQRRPPRAYRQKRVQRVYTLSYPNLITSFGRVREFNLLARLALGPRLTAERSGTIDEM